MELASTSLERAAAVITDEYLTTHLLTHIRRSITAREAWEIVEPRTKAIEPTARLIAVASGEDISSRGTASSWVFAFLLAERRGRAWFSFKPSDYDDAEAPLLLDEQIRPFGSAQQGAALPPEVRADLWQTILDKFPPLPVPFRDSPEAVQALSEQGVNFGAGDTSMTLTSKVLPSGEAVWQITSYDETYTTPFG